MNTITALADTASMRQEFIFQHHDGGKLELMTVRQACWRLSIGTKALPRRVASTKVPSGWLHSVREWRSPPAVQLELALRI